MSETPRTDAAYSIYDLRKVAQDIERQLNEANKTNRLQYELITTAEKRGVDKSKEELNAAKERIKRLEEALERLFNLPNDCCCELSNSSLDAWKNAHESLKAKEAKL